MEMNLVRQSLPGISSSDDVGIDVDVDVDDDDDVCFVEKGEKSSAAVAAQQQQHSVTIKEEVSFGLTEEEDDDDDDDEESFRDKMMHQQHQQQHSSMLCIRISDLSHNLRKSIKQLELDLDGDGNLDTEEILLAVKHLTTQTKTQLSLKRMVVVLCTFMVLLVLCVFASSITAARLAKDTEIDPISGIMYAKVGDTLHSSIMKTEAVEIYSNSNVIAEMTNDELDILKAVLLPTNKRDSSTCGDVKFQVKGYARKNDNNIMLLVEGGTITYDNDGIMDATGNAKVLLAFAYGDDYGSNQIVTVSSGAANSI